MFVTGPIEHSEAAAAIAGKPVVVREVFDRLLPELKGLAFTVTGVQDANVLQRIRDRVADLPRGGDWDAIKRDLVNELSPFLVDENAEPEVKDAQIKAAARRAELLLRTHGYQSYAAYNYRQMVETATYLPYWKYLTVRDDQVRDSHRALHGLILPWDHPFWQDHFAPWDWGCRCQVIATTDQEYKQALNNPTEQAWTLGPEAQKRLADGVLDKGDGRPVNVASPRLRAMRAGLDPNKAYAWKPGDVGIPLEQLKARYDEKTWAKVGKIFEKQVSGVSVQVSGKTSRAVTVDGGDTPEPVKTVKRDDAIDRLKAAGYPRVSIPADELLPEKTVRELESAVKWMQSNQAEIPNEIALDSGWMQDQFKRNWQIHPAAFDEITGRINIHPRLFARITPERLTLRARLGDIATDGEYYVLVHEVGHQWFWRINPRMYRADLDALQRGLALNFVSKKAAVDVAEFMAEVYAAVLYNRSLPAQVMEMYLSLRGDL